MKILVTNDDGIFSPGLWALATALKPLGNVTVVAPDREQSGMSSALTLHTPIRAYMMPVEDSSIPTYVIQGTPADSTVLALESFVGPVDLVVSGINYGSNVGTDILVSGTLGAALQGYVRGCCAIAVSVASVADLNFEVSCDLTLSLVSLLMEKDFGRPFFLNINIPALPKNKIRGIEITRMGGLSYKETVEKETRGSREYYWIQRNQPETCVEQGTDIWAIRHDRISITPLHTDMTDEKHIACLKTYIPTLERTLAQSMI